MNLFYVSPNFWHDPRVLQISADERPEAMCAWITALSWSTNQRQPGEVPTVMLHELDITDETTDYLVSVGLWERTASGIRDADHGLTRFRAPQIPWAIDPTDRAFIYERDGYACLACSSPYHLSIDHVVPKSKGGAHHRENFQTLCRPCNSSKGVQTIDYRETE